MCCTIYYKIFPLYESVIYKIRFHVMMIGYIIRGYLNMIVINMLILLFK
nr:MAG TPA: hypothetical protein [Caudoviricetes sp.]